MSGSCSNTCTEPWDWRPAAQGSFVALAAYNETGAGDMRRRGSKEKGPARMAGPKIDAWGIMGRHKDSASMPTVWKSTVIGAAFASSRIIDLPISTTSFFLSFPWFVSFTLSCFRVPALLPGARNRHAARIARAVQVRAGQSPPRFITAARTYPPTVPVTPHHWSRTSVSRGALAKWAALLTIARDAP